MYVQAHAKKASIYKINRLRVEAKASYISLEPFFTNFKIKLRAFVCATFRRVCARILSFVRRRPLIY